MSKQPNRVPTLEGPFAGSAIDRSAPLSFRLDGQVIHGFAGDTILSAALASGIDGAGTRGGERLALTDTFAPPVLPRGQENELPLPMGRTPAIDGLELVTVGRRGRAVVSGFERVSSLFRRGSRPRTLGHGFDGAPPPLGHLVSGAPHADMTADLIVVGAGVAGLSAAVAAGQAGQRVILVDRHPRVGGDAEFFGVTEHDEPLYVLLPRLKAALGSLPQVQVLTSTSAFLLSAGELLAHQVLTADGKPRGALLRVMAPKVVLATGAAERLPVFPGNRSPGVLGALEAFQRVERFGVWHGQRTTISTITGTGYRLAVKAADAGLTVDQVIDGRMQPHSRFIDFAKASGIRLGYGLVPTAVGPQQGRETGLSVAVSSTGGASKQREPLQTQQLILAGGWQPRLNLWLSAGGECHWVAREARLEALGRVPGVELAGAAAGYRGAAACAGSGEAAVAALLGQEVPQIEDPQIDPMFESDDGVFLPVRPRAVGGKHPAYLSDGDSLIALEPPDRLTRIVGRPRPGSGVGVAEHPFAIALADVVAAVQLGEIAQEHAGKVAAERCVVPTQIGPATQPWPFPDPEAKQIPDYLKGRFGEEASVWMLEPDEQRILDAGSLIFLDADNSEPASAIGVVLTTTPAGARGARCLIGKVQVATGNRVFVRDVGGAVPVRVAERPDPAA